VIADPPSSAGAVQVTTAERSPGVTVTLDGASGRPSGITGADGSEASDVLPPALAAVAVKV
jgi:hypothetical protein